MRHWRVLLRRIGRLAPYLKGESIVLEVEKDTLYVDAGNCSKMEVKQVAGDFFRNAYTL